MATVSVGSTYDVATWGVTAMPGVTATSEASTSGWDSPDDSPFTDVRTSGQIWPKGTVKQ